MILIGTSGWSYPSGAGSWNGVFYPRRSTQGFRAGDELRYYAERFETVEVNTTFYRPPEPALTSRWVRATPASFEFSVKLHQAFTHPMMRGRGAPPRANVSPVPTPGEADADAFRAGLDPIAGGGRLGRLLVQFPPAFRQSPETVDYLSSLLEAWHDYPLAVELRHRSWSDAAGPTAALLKEHGATWVQIDEPKFRFSIRQDPSRAEGESFYLRLHGRNAAEWWDHESPDDRYNYLYAPEELHPFANAAERAGGRGKAYVYLNNHFAAKAVVNATVLKHLLGQPIRGRFRRELLERYPELDGIVEVEEDGGLLE